jgi:hypothetical protein
MRDGVVIPAQKRGVFYRRRWVIAAAVIAAAIAVAIPSFFQSRAIVYPTTDFSRLPGNPGTPGSLAVPMSCVSIQRVGGTPTLVDQACGSPASTFRVIGRVASSSQCVRDADITYTWSKGRESGVVCLDYDWAAGQCLQITSNAVSKVDCQKRGALRPEMAIIGAVDVTYCQDRGFVHRVRQFTICTLAGNGASRGRTSGT